MILLILGDVCLCQMINNCTSLQMINSNLSGSYYLSQNIDCKGSSVMIGSISLPFTGVLDGKSFSISNVAISGSSSVGLFSKGNGCTVKNLVLQNFTMSGQSEVGALFGVCSSCTVTNISLSLSTISCSSTSCGGLVGCSSGGELSNTTIQKTLVKSSSSCSGGIVGKGTSLSISQCYNLGFPDPSQSVVFGASMVGGVAGMCSSCILWRIGFHSGVVNASGACVGGLIGQVEGQTQLWESYSLSSASIIASSNGGGLLGEFSFSIVTATTSSIANVYSKANVTCASQCGGLIGYINCQVLSSTFIMINNSFASNFLSSTSSSGTVLGTISTLLSSTTVCYSQVYYNNQTNPSLPAAPTSNSVGFPKALSCSQLWLLVNSSFDQATLWNGDRLKGEYNTSYGSCLCTSGCPSLPSTILQTQSPTQQPQSTQFPTTQTPLTQVPATQQQTQTSSTQNIESIAPTQSQTVQTPPTTDPQTSEPTTVAPQSAQITTFQPQSTSSPPQTENPSSYSPSNLDTSIQSTPIPPSNLGTSIQSTPAPPSTSSSPATPSFSPSSPPITTSFDTPISTSAIPTSQTPPQSSQQPTQSSSCPYQVDNCEKCPPQAVSLGIPQVNVSCINFQGEWTWSFSATKIVSSQNIFFGANTATLIQADFVNNAQIQFSEGSTLFIEGNFFQSSQGLLSFVFASSKRGTTSPPFSVGGCVSINGNISLNLETQPKQGTTNFQIISYNCSQQINISSSQIQVIPNYNGSSCDTINSQALNQPNSLGVSLTSTLGNKCNGGNNLGLIIGLSVGIPCALTIIIGGAIGYMKYKKSKQFNENIKGIGQEEMQKKGEWQENKGKQQNGIQWKEADKNFDTI